MAHPSAPQNLDDLKAFTFERVLNEDPVSHSLTILGSLGSSQAIIRIEKAALDAATAPKLLSKEGGLVQRADLEQSTDIVRLSCVVPELPLNTLYQYTWFFGWFADNRPRDVKINVICPATETHVRKVLRTCFESLSST